MINATLIGGHLILSAIAIKTIHYLGTKYNEWIANIYNKYVDEIEALNHNEDDDDN